MIKLIDENGKIKNYSNGQGIKILRETNKREKFRLAICPHTKRQVIQNWHIEDKNWLCLHD
jgi:hypothetical protein